MHDGFFAQLGALKLAGNAAFVHDERSIGHAENFLHFTRGEEDRYAFAGQLLHEAVNLFFGSHIYAARWLV